MNERRSWEYKVIVPKLRVTGKLDPNTLTEELDALGAEGWELAAAFEHLGAVLVFKRVASN